MPFLLAFGFLAVFLYLTRRHNTTDTDSPEDNNIITLVEGLADMGAQFKTGVAYVKGVAQDIQLAAISNGLYLRADAAEAYTNMMADCLRATGAGGNANSGFRTNEQQTELRKLYLEGKGNLAAPPGWSDHQDGLAVDEGNITPAGTAYNPAKDSWLTDNCGKYGWQRNGLTFGEPWHMKYTG